MRPPYSCEKTLVVRLYSPACASRAMIPNDSCQGSHTSVVQTQSKSCNEDLCHEMDCSKHLLVRTRIGMRQ